MKTVRSNWQGAVLVCGKCSKKVGGGFGPKGRTPLAKALRRLLGLKKGRRAALGVVETRCLGLCPKNAVVMVDARTPGEWLVVPAGLPLDRVAAQMAPPPQQPQSASSFATSSASSSASASP